MNTYTIQLPAHLYEAIRKEAVVQHKTPDTLAVEWLSVQVAPEVGEEREDDIGPEIVAFDQLRPTLLTQYPGQYVAIYQGQVVAVGENRLELVKEVYRQFGQVPCYVEKVTTEPLRRARITSIWKVK